MVITFRPSAPSGSSLYSVCKGNKEAPYGFAVNGQRIVQISQLFEADIVAVKGRGNQQMTVEFTVDKEYDTLAAAALAAISEIDQIPKDGTLEISETGGGPLRMAAGLEGLSISQTGVTLHMRYRFTGGKFLSASGAGLPSPPSN